MPLSLSPSLLMSSASSVAFSPLSLFASGEQGAWYDPSDLSTMFQDTAGTTPVTATGQTVARINDKSGRGNHATQATAASRPIYGIEPFGGRRNLLTYTEQFDNAAWTEAGIAAVTAGASVAPNGTATAETITANSGAGAHAIYTTSPIAVATGTNATTSVYVKKGTHRYVYIANSASTTNFYTAIFDLDGGGATATQTGVGFVSGTIVSTSQTSVGDGWFRLSVTGSATGATRFVAIGFAQAASGNTIAADSNVTYTAAGTETLLIWGAQLETGSTATAYQRVTDQWNVTQAGVPSVSYIQCDGTDDFLLTGTITPGIDKAQVFTGVRKLSDAVSAAFLESSIDTNSNAGSLAVFVPSVPGNANYRFRSRGTLPVNAESPAGYPAPITNVLTGLGDISADRATLRINGTQVAQDTNDQGTGNYLAYPLYIGRRAGTGSAFNGRIYQMIVRFGANLSAATITQAENYTAGKTGIYTVDQLIRLNTLNASGVSYNAYAAADSNGNNYPVTNTVLAADGTPYSVL